MCANTRVIAVISVTVGLLWQAGGTASLAAQGKSGLAEVARQEQDRRKTIKAPSKLLTNKDLSAPPATGTTPAAPAADTPATATDPGKTGLAPADGGNQPAEPAKDQAYWSKRWNDLQATLSRNETFAVALQSRINALANEYTNQADGVQQARIATERQKAIGDLNRLTQEIVEGKQAIADLQEEARSSGVPPGWLR
jgi:hypothetical protein